LSAESKDKTQDLKTVVTQVEASLVTLGEALGITVEETHNRFVEIDHESKLIAGAVHSMISNVGTAVEVDERFEAPTLWGTTAFIADELMRLGNEMLTMDLTVKPIQIELEWFRNVVQSMQVSEESMAKMLKIIGMVMERIQAVGPELSAVKARVKKVEQVQKEELEERSAKRTRLENKGWKSDSHVSGEQKPKPSSDSSMDDLLRMLEGNTMNSPDLPRIINNE
jgi:hypothetical protein